MKNFTYRNTLLLVAYAVFGLGSVGYAATNNTDNAPPFESGPQLASCTVSQPSQRAQRAATEVGGAATFRLVQALGGQQAYQSRVFVQYRGAASSAVGTPNNGAVSQARGPVSVQYRGFIYPHQIGSPSAPYASPYPYPWNGPYPFPIPNPFASPYPYLAPPINFPGVNYPYLNPVVPPTYGSSPMSGYYFPDYVPDDYSDTGGYGDDDVFPAVYGMYDGMPGYFDCQDGSIVVAPPSPYIVSDGMWYPDDYDPYDQQTVEQPVEDDPSASGDDSGSESSDSAMPQGLSRSLSDIAQAWKTRDIGGIKQHLSPNSLLQVSFSGKYTYSIGANDYALMTRDAMQRLGTTDFRFTGVNVQPNGDSVGYAEQDYRTSNGGVSKMYLAYTFRRDSSQSAGYSLIGIGTSPRPLAVMTPSNARSAARTNASSAAAR